LQLATLFFILGSLFLIGAFLFLAGFFLTADLLPEGDSTRLTIKAGTMALTARGGLGRNKTKVRMSRCPKTENTSIWLKSIDWENWALMSF